MVYYYIMQVVRVLLASRYDIDINVKNSDGKTAWDILQEQTQVDNEEIRAMLLRGRALPASSLPTVASYATYLRQPKFVFLEKLRRNYFRVRTRRLDDNRNALLVVAILLVTVTYQGVLSPPGGFWQDTIKKPVGNGHMTSAMPISTVSGNQNISDGNWTQPPLVLGSANIRSMSQSHVAGTAVGFTTYPFWIFMSLNSVAFMLSSTIIFLLIPFEYIYVMFQAALVFLNICYFSSLMVIGVSVWTVIILVSVSALLFILVVLKGLS
jgi:hypothetical protein